ncbi:MAG TPA: polysaccharide deacetylase family protein [Nocardioidaceae bacterium]|nr:polysaccharide deacetylase family protein [Nocardioidaceae bacterium]
MAVPVFMYHSVTDHPVDATRSLSVSPRLLAEQLAALADLGFTGVSFSRLRDALVRDEHLPDRTVVLTFDDGYDDFHGAALPLLERHGFSATVFVTTGWVRDAGRHAAGRPLARTLSWSQVAEAAAAGVEIGAHSHSHPELDQLPQRALQDELRTSKALLEDRLDGAVRSLAYPYGYSSRRVRAAAAAVGYDAAAAVANAVARDDADPFAVPRLTVRRSMTAETLEALAHRRAVTRTYALQRVMTKGWASVRRTRSVATRLAGG